MIVGENEAEQVAFLRESSEMLRTQMHGTRALVCC